ncbi:MAG: hypothetical protein JST08_14240 [Actinobacteria bacterium]|nr:hypothetical protein [Actinomycetota bacterium]
MSRPIRLKTLPLLLALVCGLLIGCTFLAEGPEEILAALPLVGICLALAFDFYPGEKLIARLARRRPARRPSRRPVMAGRTSPRVLSPRGSALLAFNLATRPPPASFSG